MDGSVITGATVGDDQAFGIGVADQAVGGNTFKGDSGQMITISGYNTADTIEDFTGDGDSATQMRSSISKCQARGNCRSRSRLDGSGWRSSFRRCSGMPPSAR